MSVPLNIGEATGKTNGAERSHCYRIARGEAMECGAILDVVRLMRVIPDAELDRGKLLLVRVVGMLSKLANRTEDEHVARGTCTRHEDVYALSSTNT